MSSFSRGMELKAQINICIGARQTTEICCHSREGNGIFPISPAASVLGRQIMNGLVVLCTVAPYSLTGAAAACVFSSQHLTTYPFLPSLYLSFSLFPRKGKISGINLNLPPLEANWHRQRRGCYNILHVRQSCLPKSALEATHPTLRPCDGRS